MTDKMPFDLGVTGRIIFQVELPLKALGRDMNWKHSRNKIQAKCAESRAKGEISQR